MENKKLPIVMFTMSRWDSHISSASYCLAKEFAKHRDVYYIDMPYTWLDVLKYFKREDINKRIPQIIFGRKSLIPLKHIRPGLSTIVSFCIPPINWMPGGGVYSFFQKINDTIVCRKIAKVLRKQGVVDYIYFNSFNPFYGESLTRLMKPATRIYQSRDDVETLDYVWKHGPKLEVEQIRKANKRYATSAYLAKKLQGKSGKEITLLNNGVEIDLFLDQESTTSQIEAPKIVFFSGNMDKRVDFTLLKESAQALPQHIFRLVGPISSQTFYDLEIDKVPNIEVMGGMPIQQMAEQMAHSDVTLIPFVKNEQTKSIYPLKVNEYLACGKPVVATNFSDDLLHFKGVIGIANSNQEFIELILAEIANNNAEKMEQRKKLAIDNSWKSRVQIIEKDLLELLA